ncbi:hypothetical protein Bca101_004322 [Brassica carinata]
MIRTDWVMHEYRLDDKDCDDPSSLQLIAQSFIPPSVFYGLIDRVSMGVKFDDLTFPAFTTSCLGKKQEERLFTRPQYPLMLWEPAAPVHPKLIQEIPEGLTKDEALEFMVKGMTHMQVV